METPRRRPTARITRRWPTSTETRSSTTYRGIERRHEGLLGIGDGTFGAANAVSTTSYSTRKVGTGDFNGDGWADFVTANSNSSLSQLHLSDGDGTFTSSNVSGSIGTWGQAVALADIDGDGDLDIAGVEPGFRRERRLSQRPAEPAVSNRHECRRRADLTPVPVFVSALLRPT